MDGATGDGKIPPHRWLVWQEYLHQCSMFVMPLVPIYHRPCVSRNRSSPLPSLVSVGWNFRSTHRLPTLLRPAELFNIPFSIIVVVNALVGRPAGAVCERRLLFATLLGSTHFLGRWKRGEGGMWGRQVHFFRPAHTGLPSLKGEETGY